MRSRLPGRAAPHPAKTRRSTNGNPPSSRRDTGAHLDRLLETPIPLDSFRSRGLLVDVRDECARREIRPDDLPERVLPGDFVIFWSGRLERLGYGSREYLDAPFALSWELVDHLLERRVRFIGVDARGIRGNAEHRRADEHYERGGAFVIENLSDLERLPVGMPLTVYTLCFDNGGTGVPCRVVAETKEAPAPRK